MSLTSVIQTVAAAMPAGHAHVYGPPFRVPPAPPCYVIEMPQLRDVVGVGADCAVTAATVDIVCVPTTGTDHDQLVTMADQVVAAFGSATVAGAAEPNPYTDVDDVVVYRLTVEV